MTAPPALATAPPDVAAAEPVLLWRRMVAEAVGTGLLVAAIVGSGIAATGATPDDPGLQLAYHAAATAAALAVLIAVFAPVSGAHFNPAVTLLDWLATRRQPGAGPAALGYLTAQFAGGAAGAVLANVMFDLPAVAVPATDRSGVGAWVGEIVATAGLLLVIGALRRSGQQRAIPLAVGGWIGAAIWFTASSAFANPAVTAARMLTDSFTGIAPAAAAGFVIAQLLGAALGVGVVRLCWPGKDPR